MVETEMTVVGGGEVAGPAKTRHDVQRPSACCGNLRAD